MSNENNDSVSQGESQESGADDAPVRVTLPPEKEVIKQVQQLLGNKKVSIESLTETIALDPVIVIELLRVANSVTNSAARTQVIAISNAIISLGMVQVGQVLDQLLTREKLSSSELNTALEEQRTHCVEIARVARTIARAISPSVANTAYTTGLLVHIGDMLVISELRGKYLEIAKSQGKRSKINYRLMQDFEYDVEANGIEFLQQTGVPEKIVSSINRNAVPQSAESAEVRTICFSAIEMIEAFESGRWERLAPGQKIPSSSSIRMLQLTDQKYAELYEKVSAYFGGDAETEDAFTADEIKQEAAAVSAPAYVEDAVPPATPAEPTPDPVEASSPDTAQKAISEEVALTSAPVNEAPPTPTGSSKRLDSMFGETLSWLKKAKDTKQEQKQKTEEDRLSIPEVPQSTASKTQEALSGIEDMISAAANSEQLLTQLLSQLVTCGFFKKSALLVIAEDRKSATVRVAAGSALSKGQQIQIDDPLSPLARAASKVQSIGNKDSEVSPFGTKAFALAPIESNHELPVVLYADCGDEAISLAGRRFFRGVVSALNERLSILPGGLPE